MKKSKIILALIIISTLVFTACNKDEASEKESDKKPSQEVEVTKEKTKEVRLEIVTQFGGLDLPANIYKNLIDEFDSANPSIKLNHEIGIGDEAWKATLAADFIAGNEPDLIFTYTGVEAGSIVKNEKVISISEIRKDFPEFANNITDAAFEAIKEVNGEIYAVPIQGFYQGLFVNNFIFEEHNLELPANWNKLEIAIDSLNTIGITPLALAINEKPDLWIDHLIFSEAGLQGHKNQNISQVKEKWVSGLNYFKILNDKKAFPKSVINNDEAIEMFNNGEAAMILEDNNLIDRLENTERFTLIPFPTVPEGSKGSTDIISGFSKGWYITKKAWDNEEKREALVKFISHMTSNESIKAFNKTGGLPAADIGELTGQAEIIRDGLLMEKNANNKSEPIKTWLSKQAWDELVKSVPGIVENNISSEDVIDKVIAIFY